MESMPTNTNEKSPSQWSDFFDSKITQGLATVAGSAAAVDGLIGINFNLFETVTKAVETMSLRMPENGLDLARSAVEVVVAGIIFEIMRKKSLVSEEQPL
jgi:hypothetical protein